jgi:methylated-DNA-[protein]-cysteine S-methyltransferase
MSQANYQRRELDEKFEGDWDAVINAPFGHMGIQTELVEQSLMVSQIAYLPADVKLKSAKTDLAKEVARQCKHYFKDPDFMFDLPLKPGGTQFQQTVWAEISKIARGQTQTYGWVAKKITSAPRAVGQACGANRYPLIIPCHRIISATGIGGFAHQEGDGFHRNVKKWLLDHEGVTLAAK